MITENDILLNIYKTTNNFLIQIYETRINVSRIKYDISNLDNTFFMQDKNNIYPNLLDAFDEASLEILTQKLLTNKNIVEDKLNNICAHEWISDYIDIAPEISQQICYCRLCEITKK